MKLRYFLLSLCLCVFVFHLPKAAAQIENARWIGAISKQEAKIPTGRWSNAVFKKDSFKLKWQDVDSLSARSIIVKKDFKAKGKIAKAVVDVCGLGHYELTINGQKVGDSEFAPLWSEYDKTVYYNRYDVTDFLRRGINRMETLLGNGMFNVQRGSRYSKLQQSFGPPQLLLRLVITYRNGKQQIVESDGSWQWCLSPITFNSIYGGESYEAPLESPPWGEGLAARGLYRRTQRNASPTDCSACKDYGALRCEVMELHFARFHRGCIESHKANNPERSLRL